jgi:hypothetical protein
MTSEEDLVGGRARGNTAFAHTMTSEEDLVGGRARGNTAFAHTMTSEEDLVGGRARGNTAFAHTMTSEEDLGGWQSAWQHGLCTHLGLFVSILQLCAVGKERGGGCDGVDGERCMSECVSRWAGGGEDTVSDMQWPVQMCVYMYEVRVCRAACASM